MESPKSPVTHSGGIPGSNPDFHLLLSPGHGLTHHPEAGISLATVGAG